MSAPALDALKAARSAALDEARAVLERSRDGLRAARHLSTAQDSILVRSFSTLVQKDTGQAGTLQSAPFCLCATGGYGRGELAPGSDLDLLLLHNGPVTDNVQRAYTDLLYLLWDCGLKVGHALRQPEECAVLAAKDTVAVTALMDTRMLVGNPALPATMKARLGKAASAKADRAFIAAKLRERDTRHVRLGRSRYMVEPHVKDGKGGLRDLQTLGWLALRLRPEAASARAALAPFLDAPSLHRYDRALRFLWTVRFWLHLVTGRAEDRLSFDVQPELARVMGYRDTPAVERLMKAYFLKARDVGALTRVLCARLESLAAKRAPAGLDRFFPRWRKAMKARGFVSEGGRLDFAGAGVLETDTLNLLRLFATAGDAGCDIHPEALQLVHDRAALIRDGFRRDPAAADIFLKCLTGARQPEAVLRLMSESGILGRYIPEFGHITGRTQFNMYHHYTVDEHSLRAVGFVHALLHGKKDIAPPWIAPVAKAIQNRRALMLAMLLHDTGKGTGDQQVEGAKVVRRVCGRLGLAAAETGLVSWLVGHHLLMSDVAQKRDLDDPRTILDFTASVQTPERLRLLLLLTIADIRAVGPGVWNGWKERLLRELFEASMSFFRGRTVRTLQALQEAAETRAATGRARFVAASANKAAAQAWAQSLDASYWNAFDPDVIADQGQWAMPVIEKDAAFGIFVHPRPVDDSTIMRVLARDAPGLFATLCGAVCAAGGNIAGARIFTTSDGRAFDVFYIQDQRGRPFGEDNAPALARLKAQVRAGLQDQTPDAVHRRPPSRRAAAFAVLPAVVFDNDASVRHTIIEASGRDHQGLLHDLAQVLRQSGLNIRSAHISTYGARAVDVFYVHEKNDGKITNARRRHAIGAKLRAVLHAGANRSQKQPFPLGQARASEHQ